LIVGNDRPAPIPTALTAPFWEAAARSTLVRQVCGACGQNFFTPRLACPNCLSESWSWEESSGRGRIYSFTVCHRAPVPGFSVPYVLAIVELDEGWSMLTNLVDGEPSEIDIGTQVQVAWLSVADGQTLPVFRLAAAGQ
jgi:uncharacterized OB-fold protein